MIALYEKLQPGLGETGANDNNNNHNPDIPRAANKSKTCRTNVKGKDSIIRSSQIYNPQYQRQKKTVPSSSGLLDSTELSQEL